MIKLNSMFFVGSAVTTIIGLCNSIFYGRVVAKLPFIPIGFIQGISHRNLAGDDLSDCSFIFLYMLSAMSIRANVQKISGFAPSRAGQEQAEANMWPK